METKKIETGILTRILEVKESTANKDSRTLDISFSSEAPVERSFGSEILDHSPKSVDLGRLNNAAPVLFNHNIDVPIGVVENARIDGKVGRAQIRFGKSEKANEIFQDVMDGILQNVSVGYSVERMEQTKENPPEYRVVSWNPHELSLVTIPADNSVGLFRDQETRFQTEIIELPKKQKPKMEEVQERSIDMDAAIKEAGQAEQKRIREIEAYGREHKETELADEYIKEGKSVGEFAATVLERIKNRPKEHYDVGLTKTETSDFSFLRLVNALARPHDKTAQDNAAFELNACRAQEKKQHREARGVYIPNEVLHERSLSNQTTYKKRELLAGSGDGANLVPTILDGSSFIEFLDNNMVTVAMGARVLRNLDGIIKIPRRDAAITGGWIAESTDAADVTPSYDQLTLSAKTYALRVDLSRQLRLQSSLDVERLVREEISLSTAVALDEACLVSLGESNDPAGICNTAGVGITLITADQFSWANAMAMQGDVMSANAYQGSLGYAIHPVLAADAKARSRDSGSGRFVMEGNDIGGFRAEVTSSLVMGGKQRAIFGDWSQALLGYWSPGIDVSVHREFDDGRIRLIVFVDADFGVRHAGSFAITNDS
jgi:HK97 family phage major capsid protein/HK97 family phage prohead protease